MAAYHKERRKMSKAMKEVYRSFEEKLNVDNQSGYIIYETEDFCQVEFLSVWSDQEDIKVRIRKGFLTEVDFTDPDKIISLQMDIENGCGDYGRCFFNDK